MLKEIVQILSCYLFFSCNDMSVIVDPELPIRHECYGCLSGTEIFSIFSNQKIASIKQVTIYVVNDAGCSVVWIWSFLSLGLFNRFSFPIVIARDFSKRSFEPFNLRVHNPALPNFS